MGHAPPRIINCPHTPGFPEQVARPQETQPMPDDARVTALLTYWQEQQRQGNDIPAEELCRDCPDLQTEVGQRLQSLRQMPHLVAGVNASQAEAAEDATLP